MANKKMDHLIIGSDNFEIIDAAGRNSLAPAYSTSGTYAVGDFVVYNGQLYVCKTAITTAEAWTAAHWTAVTVGAELKNLDNDIVNGNYDDFTAGSAKELLSDKYTEDKEPYMIRKTPVDSGMEIDSLVGGSVAWNQLCNATALTNTSDGVTFTKNNDGSYTISGTPTTDNAFYNIDYVIGINYLSGNHVYFVPKGTSNSQNIGVAMFCTSGIITDYQNLADSIIKVSNAQAQSETSWMRLQVYGMTNTQISGTVKVYPQLFDLTQMFGSTIADYIYSLETATAGAGVAWFRKYFPDDYYAYNAGELKHVQASAHKTVGKNLLKYPYQYLSSARNITNNGVTFTFLEDGSCICNGTASAYAEAVLYDGFPDRPGWLELTEILEPGKQYKITGGHDGVRVTVFYYTNGSTGWTNITRSQNGGEGSFVCQEGIVYGMSIDVGANSTVSDVHVFPMLRLASVSDATYEPYESHTYPLDSTLTLRGIPKLDSNNKLYYDGDTYSDDGTVVRKYGVVNLGSLNWLRADTNTSGLYRFTSSGINTLVKAPSSNDTVANIICGKYLSIIANGPINNIDGIAIHTNGNLIVYDSNNNTITAADFKTAVNGVYLVYELATPTTESKASFKNPQNCDGNGTEQYVSTSVVPVGHYTKYLKNLKGILDDIPSLPTSAGTYTLKVTVSGGVPTYTWQSS